MLGIVPAGCDRLKNGGQRWEGGVDDWFPLDEGHYGRYEVLRGIGRLLCLLIYHRGPTRLLRLFKKSFRAV